MTTVALSEATEINAPPRRRPAADEDVSFLPMSDVDVDGRTGPGTSRPFDEVSRGYTLFERGDVLVAKITPCFENGKIAQAATTSEVAAGSTEFHVVRPIPSIADARYVLHFLRHPHVRSAGERRMTGSGGQRRVPEAFLRDLEIPLPPIEEQRRIAAALDQADELRAKRQASLALIDSLNESIFLEMFGDPVANPFEWPADETLGDVAEITSGITKGRRLRSAEVRSVPYLAVANVQHGHLRLEAVKTIEATPEEIARYRLVAGDLVLTEGGDPDKLGRGTVWSGEIGECIHQNHIFRVRIVGPGVEPIFVSTLLASSRGRRYFRAAAKQTTGIASINMSQLRSFPMLKPPAEKQREFVEQLQRRADLNLAAERHAAELGALFASLQYRAFAGQL